MKKEDLGGVRFVSLIGGEDGNPDPTDLCPFVQKAEKLVPFFFMTVFSLSLLIACTGPQVQKEPAKGVYHIVKKGETAYSISRAYSISLQELARINNIKDVSNIKVGSVIFIPDAVYRIDDVMAAAKTADTDSRRSTSGGRKSFRA